MAKILIVEDNALNIKLFCDLLAAHGHAPAKPVEEALPQGDGDHAEELPLCMTASCERSRTGS